MKKEIKFKEYIVIKRIFFLTIMLLTFSIIYAFSEQNEEISGSLSIKVTEFIVEVISKITNIDLVTKIHYVEKLHLIVRKLAHFSIYLVVGFSTMGFMCTFNMRNSIKIILSLCIGTSYAITDEIHQSFIPGRCPSILDVGIDSLGVISGIFIIILLIIVTEKISTNIKNKSKSKEVLS